MVTLILLSIITFMAIAFLVISRSGKDNVVTSTDQTLARLATDTGTERALAEAVASIMATRNPYNYGPASPTNYINSYGFVSGNSNPTNVNYDYKALPGNPPLTLADLQQNIANLLFNPRVPVIMTNRLLRTNEFRYYLDLNRNGRFDPTGLLVVTNSLGLPYVPVPGGTNVLDYFIGDPQWIGMLQFPDRPHSANNLFISRYTYFVVPVGNTLDVNYIHNYVKAPDPTRMRNRPGDGFFRNQGVGSWEINLAAFLVDLNTNQWQPATAQYTYNWQTQPPSPYPTTPNSGAAFDDALSILRYRYAADRRSLLSVFSIFGLPGVRAFDNDYVDGYTAGPPMIGTLWPGGSSMDSDVALVSKTPWSGANNTNHYFTLQDLFDRAKLTYNQLSADIPPVIFPDRLLMAGTNIDSYNRYTFYRLASQLGTDSAPEAAPAMPKRVTALARYGTEDMIATVPNHGYFSGDNVTITSGNPPAYQRIFKISVLDATNFVLLKAQGSPVPDPASTFALDPYQNAKIDLNYDNVNYLREIFTNWTPVDFFTAAADRMLRRQHGMFLNNIPVRQTLSTNATVYNCYTPSVHRILQLAANIYDATANTSQRAYPCPPTIFRPIFRSDAAGRVFIAGYRQVVGTTLVNAGTPGAPRMLELDVPNDVANIPPQGKPIDLTRVLDDDQEPLVSGVPLVVGAKKGFPNFNEFSSETGVHVTRRLRFHRDSSDNITTNQSYVVIVTNMFGIEAWNSYFTNYPRPLQMVVRGSITALMTNEWSSNNLITNSIASLATSTNIPAGTWAGWYDVNRAWASFRIPVSNIFSFLPPMSYSPAANGGNGGFVDLINTVPVPRGGPFYLPHWWLNLKTQLRYILVDGTNIVDYVNLARSEGTVDLTAELASEPQLVEDENGRGLWNTNRVGAPFDNTVMTYGMYIQFRLSWPDLYLQDTKWNGYNFDPSVPQGNTKNQAIGAFYYNITGRVHPDARYQGTYYRTNDFFAPYVPSIARFKWVNWQANDPLVHYTIGDLMDLQASQTNELSSYPRGLQNLGSINSRYEPWGGSPLVSSTAGQDYDWRVKDPVALPFGRSQGRSDDWDFPTNKFPNIGGLGGIHRGTPWQTVYLKASDVDTNLWATWSGNPVTVTNIGQMDTNMPNVLPFLWATNDASYTLPVNDRALLDIFTTAFNDNAALGRLSINQTNLAAWSAVLSGVIALTNTSTAADLKGGQFPQFAPRVIDPAGVYAPSFPTPVARIVNAINDTRAINPTKAFTHLGDILSTPELTVSTNAHYVGTYPNGYWAGVSPFLNLGGPGELYPGKTLTYQQVSGLNDAAYERIPRQILGLLKVDSVPRFVVYSYGQALKPAPRSVLTGGPLVGLCTNYQITAEAATRAVVRIEGAPNNPHAVIENFNLIPPN